MFFRCQIYSSAKIWIPISALLILHGDIYLFFHHTIHIQHGCWTISNMSVAHSFGSAALTMKTFCKAMTWLLFVSIGEYYAPTFPNVYISALLKSKIIIDKIRHSVRVNKKEKNKYKTINNSCKNSTRVLYQFLHYCLMCATTAYCDETIGNM